MKKLWIIISILMLYSSVYAADCGTDGNNNSCTAAGLASLISAASDGDTINIASGSHDMTSAVLFDNKSLIIKGKGKALTNIVNKVPNPSYSTTAIMWKFNLGSDKTLELSDMEITDDDAVTFNAMGAVRIYGTYNPIPRFRVYNINMHDLVNRGFRVDVVFGVFHDCTFTNNTGHDFYIFGDRDAAFERGDKKGTEQAVFIEDCTITNTGGAYGASGLTDNSDGASIVLRNNTITNKWWMSHGYGDITALYRGSLLAEVYDNTFAADAECSHWLRFRGGTGTVFRNTVTETGSGAWGYNESRGLTFCTYQIGAKADPCTSMDNQLARCETYPCTDQIGFVGTTLTPWYEWLNTLDGSAIPGTFITTCTGGGSDCTDCSTSPVSDGTCTGSDDCMSCFIRNDREYYKYTASFDGTSGVGSGTAAAMALITPTLTGVGFWVTDEGEWDSTNGATADGRMYTWDGDSWELSYTPSDFPHSLRGTAAPSGQPITGGFTEDQIRTGNVSFDIDLTGTTFVSTVGDGISDATDTAVIAGIIALTNQTHGWNNEVILSYADLNQISTTKLRVTIHPVGDNYDIEVAENIQITLPASSNALSAAILCDGYVTISPVAVQAETISAQYNANAPSWLYSPTGLTITTP